MRLFCIAAIVKFYNRRASGSIAPKIRMEILREQRDYIANTVAMAVVLEEVFETGAIRSGEYARMLNIGDHWKDEGCNVFEVNKAMYDALLDYLTRCNDNCECLYALFEAIRRKYPNVAVHIPAIHQGMRYLVALGSDVILSVFTNIHQEIVYDIRKMRVSSIINLQKKLVS